MQWLGKLYLVSISLSLYVLISVPTELKTSIQGREVMVHLNLLENRGFKCNRIIVDPERALVKLRNMIPGAEIDLVGAGDHLNLIDIQIRRLKDVGRAMISDLPYVLPKNIIDNLIAYSTNRKNSCRTKALNDNLCSRV